MNLLDNVMKVQKLDPQNMLPCVETVPQQCRDARNYAFLKNINLDKSKINTLLVLGVGGSAISGEMVAVYLRQTLKIPIVINRNYDLPAWVNQKTLVICSSYSGETEETLTAFKQATARKLNIVVMTSGGTLLKEARKRSLPYYEMPKGIQPRAVVSYSFITLLTLFEKLKLLPSLTNDIEKTGLLLDKLTIDYQLSNPTKYNIAKQLALFFYGKNPVIYTNESYFSASAYRWKCQLNENSKQMASVNFIPEMNHNEILAYSNVDLFIKNAGVLFLRSEKYDSAQIQKRYDIFKKIIGLKTENIKEFWIEGSSLLSQTLAVVYLGDFVSVYLAFLKGLNPTPIELIDKLKINLKK